MRKTVLVLVIAATFPAHALAQQHFPSDTSLPSPQRVGESWDIPVPQALPSGPPSDALGYKLHGMAWRSACKWAEAIGDFSLSLALDPRQPDAYALRGHAWLQLQNYDKAADDLDRALLLDPRLACAYYRRAQAANAKWSVAKIAAPLKEWNVAKTKQKAQADKQTAAGKDVTAATKKASDAKTKADKLKAIADGTGADLALVQSQFEEANRAIGRAIACCDPICFKNAQYMLAVVKDNRTAAKKAADDANAASDKAKNDSDAAAKELSTKQGDQTKADDAATAAKKALDEKAAQLNAIALELQQAICGCKKAICLAPSCVRQCCAEEEKATAGLKTLTQGKGSFQYNKIECEKCGN